MGFLSTIATILGLVGTAEPLIEKLLGGLGTFIAGIAKQLWGDAAAVQVTNILDAAERIVGTVTTDAEEAMKFIQTMWPTIQDLEKMFPGTAQAIVAKHTLMRDMPGLPHAVATKAVEIAHANLKTAVATKV